MRKQAAVTLRCMQALVRVQARVRARRVRMSVEGQAVQKMLDERHANEQILKQAEVYIIYIYVYAFYWIAIQFVDSQIFRFSGRMV